MTSKRRQRAELAGSTVLWAGIYLAMALASEVPWLLAWGMIAFVFALFGVSLVIGNRRNADVLKAEKQAAVRERAAKTLHRAAEVLGSSYGDYVVTPVQKKVPLPPVNVPFNTSPPVSAGGPGPEWLIVPSTITEAELADFRRRFTESLVPLAPYNLYVPEGQEELSEMLLELLEDEVRARGGPPGFFPSYRWYMHPEWLAEVRKLKDKNERLLCIPRPGQSTERLYGYPVTVGDEFGVPELREVK